MNWKLFAVALAVPLAAGAAETQGNQPKEPSPRSGTTADRYAKPGAPVDLTYTAPKLAVGGSGTVELVFHTQADQGDLKVKVKADDALTIGGPADGDFRIPLSSATHTYPVEIPVTSTVDGLYYVSIFASMDVGGNTLNRAFAVPVQVGSASLRLKSSGGLETDEKGNPIVVMPATETIK